MAVALYTFGQFIQPSEHPTNDGFHEMNDPVFETVDQAPGLIARSGYASDPGPAPWGEEVYPSFYDALGDGWAPATLSLWETLEAAYGFTYSGLHLQALKRGRDCFRKGDWPPLVLWWHHGDARPQWSEGVTRIERLHQDGPNPDAFTFRAAFGPDGAPYRLERPAKA